MKIEEFNVASRWKHHIIKPHISRNIFLKYLSRLSRTIDEISEITDPFASTDNHVSLPTDSTTILSPNRVPLGLFYYMFLLNIFETKVVYWFFYFY